MTMTVKNWPTLIAPGLRKVFHERLRGREELFKRTEIFPIDKSQKAYEDYQGIGELGQEGWNEFEKTGRVPYDGFDPGFKTRMEHRQYAKGVVFERALMDDNLYPEAGIPKDFTGKVEKLADSAGVAREKSAADVFVNAFTDTGLDAEGFSVSGADGVGLCSTAHVDSPSHSTTQSNKGTEAFGEAGVKATQLLMRRFHDDRGQQIATHPDTLLVPPELEDKALKLLNSELQAGTNNNDLNVLKGRFNVVGWDYLTDPKAWFMLDSVLKSQHLVWLDRIAPEFQSVEDFDTLQAKFRVYYRCSRGFDDWRWIFGNKEP